MIRQFELVERVQSYDPDTDEDMLNRAYVYGLKKHGTQLRASGDPYFSHPVEVAGILAEMKLDASSIVTGRPAICDSNIAHTIATARVPTEPSTSGFDPVRMHRANSAYSRAISLRSVVAKSNPYVQGHSLSNSTAASGSS